MNNICIGLFGTCGKSTWRNELFIPKYKELGLVDGANFFNPQVSDWKPELAEIEAKHLAEDQIILFPVTKETYGTGSLAETGFSILQAFKFDDRREIILLIDPVPDPSLNVDDPDKKLSKVAYQESARARALTLQHIKKLNWANVRLVDTMEEMLEWSIFLYNQKKAIIEFKDKLKNKPAPTPVTVEPKVERVPVDFHGSMEEFKSQLENGVTVVDLWAPWCGPCRMVAPIVKELNSEFPSVNFIKVDTDEHPNLAREYEVRSIPTLLLFKDGQLMEKLVGAYPKSTIKERFKLGSND